MPQVVNIRSGSSFGYKGQNPYSYVGRPTALGNPFVIAGGITREQVLIQHEEYIFEHQEKWPLILALQGRDLGCFCSPERCHADLYLWMANTPEIRALVTSILSGKKPVKELKKAWISYKATMKVAA